MRCALFYYDRIVELNTYVKIKYVLSKRALFLYMNKTVVVEFSEKGSKHIKNSVILLVEQRSEERRA